MDATSEDVELVETFPGTDEAADISPETAAATVDISPRISVSEKYYVDHGNDKRILIALCIGLKNASGNPLINNEKEPWSKHSSEIRKPKLKDHLYPEIICRSCDFAREFLFNECTDW